MGQRCERDRGERQREPGALPHLLADLGVAPAALQLRDRRGQREQHAHQIGWVSAASEIAASASASQALCRTSSPISAWRPPPCSCAIVGVSANSTPISVMNSVTYTLVPIPTAARSSVP